MQCLDVLHQSLRKTVDFPRCTCFDIRSLECLKFKSLLNLSNMLIVIHAYVFHMKSYYVFADVNEDLSCLAVAICYSLLKSV